MRLLAVPGAALAGAVMAGCGVAIHQWWWGVLLTWLTAVAVVLALPVGWLLRPAYAAGFTVVVWRAATPRPDGGFLVTGTAHGYGLILAVLVLIVVALVTLPARRGPGVSRRTGK